MLEVVTRHLPPLDSAPVACSRCRVTGREYRRAFGGIGWPSGPHGALVVVGETRVRGRHGHEFRVLAESHQQDVQSLFDRALQLRSMYFVTRWVSDLSDEAMLSLWTVANRQHRARVLLADTHFGLPSGVYPVGCPGPSSAPTLRFYHDLLLPLLSESRKRLYLDGAKEVRTALEALRVEDLERPASRAPVLAALGYAVSGLVFYPYRVSGRRPDPYSALDPVAGF